ncbi:MAG: 4Fe-4S dicluster domain-containing protein [Gammaproteobacteria bacterium]|nr:4Fe-4S dicluster domain-containing protein [Gammaproteobacteria bacterium]NIN39621.1 4Fe-4S dicluster domain-containing protein [Gammaproteobacteria bacterium]NIO25178.1 4Fe-4S dicluster domain-containing protein [Gammaproteobacteria bacterium]NIO65807.1 4Fe-4S dicluster domain-containing protein [Gammaproteobacteria bacterium]NIP45754.1 4Fe-4S dicluster domain-containing protein [Gammaproteobacteria bacterium]
MSAADSSPADRSRRRFLARAGAAVAAGVAAGVQIVEFPRARAATGEPVSGAQRWGMLIDASKCADGCTACVQACNDEHGLTGHGRPETDAQWIRKVRLRDRASGRETSLPLMCQHCENPPCVDVCPTGASFRRADGIVLVDKHSCIGCRYCMLACPFKARSFIHENLSDQKPWSPRGKGTVESCNLCVHRVDEGNGRTTACAEACAREGHGAIVFGDLNNPTSSIAKAMAEGQSQELRADLGLDAGVRYQNL